MRVWKDIARKMEETAVSFDDENNIAKLMSVRYEPTSAAKTSWGEKDSRGLNIYAKPYIAPR